MNTPVVGDAVAHKHPQSNRALWLRPGQKPRQRAAVLSVLGSLVWPAQAALVAVALGGLLTGAPVSPLWVASAYVGLGALRALFGVLAEALSLIHI